MHPIFFRIPLFGVTPKLWWALAAVAVVALVYAALGARRKDWPGAAMSIVVAGAAAGGAFKFHEIAFSGPSVPIYSYGVMLGLSFVVGWYLTLGLAEKIGLDKEVMANCYVVTAVSALVCSRLLYVVTNLDEFHSLADVLALRRGGLVAYGGFLGGFLGSLVFLRMQGLRLLPWADVAVPSLGSGLMITRLGCYMFGCDFGKPLGPDAPGWLKSLGTFPHWAQGTLDHGEGSPAWVQHINRHLISPDAAASLPVHPTQLYESLVGATLLAATLFVSRKQTFRGQVFFVFTYGYGVLRFLLELIRDDAERGEYGMRLPEHVFVAGALAALAAGWAFGIAPDVREVVLRRVTQVVAFVPAVVAYLMLKPDSFADQAMVQLSTSQWVGVLTAVPAAFVYGVFARAAKAHPASAMSLGTGVAKAAPAADDAPQSSPPPPPAAADEHAGDEEHP